MTEKDDKLTKLLVSGAAEIINKRFMTKTSVFDNGVDKSSTMFVVHDLLENNFKIQFYESSAEVIDIIKILREATK